jgi:hypothetical protein
MIRRHIILNSATGSVNTILQFTHRFAPTLEYFQPNYCKQFLFPHVLPIPAFIRMTQAWLKQAACCETRCPYVPMSQTLQNFLRCTGLRLGPKVRCKFRIFGVVRYHDNSWTVRNNMQSAFSEISHILYILFTLMLICCKADPHCRRHNAQKLASVVLH